MAIIVRPLTSGRQMKAFVRFRIDLYRDCPYAVPPLYIDELTTLDPKKNPAFAFSEAQCFMAFDADRPVGRICAIINRRANEVWGGASGRFGFVDFIDDPAVSKALFTAAEDWVRSKGMHSIHGPLGFTDLDQEGMLVEGFDQLGTMATIYNHPYYPAHIEQLGYVSDAEWVEFRITVPPVVPDRLRRIAELVLQRQRLRIVKYSSARRLLKDGYVRKLFGLVNESYSHLYGFTPLTDEQIDYYGKLYVPLLNLDYLTLVENEAGELVGMGLAIPSLAMALRKAQGRLLPFGFVHILKALKLKNPVIDLLLVAVRKDYQNKGVNSLFFYDMIPHVRRSGVLFAESNPELVSNTKVQSQWDMFECVNHKRRRAYVRQLDAAPAMAAPQSEPPAGPDRH
jgi:GNAT superfamily N-acetyltransferase